ncbi:MULTISPECIES: VOC family protein [unclassified Ensifer]|uniref:VOC family protein n=1 Tax=unclassified Ensifer TaxID=2633371 RepID=UPI0030105E25
MVASVTPFLMFQDGAAEAAMAFYMSLFPNAEVLGEQGPEGSIKVALFRLGAQRVKCIDSPVKHAFDFTPSFSFFVECQSEDEIITLATMLAEEGAVLMPLDNYGFSQRFSWVNDRFGVSWQLNLAA